MNLTGLLSRNSMWQKFFSILRMFIAAFEFQNDRNFKSIRIELVLKIFLKLQLIFKFQTWSNSNDSIFFSIDSTLYFHFSIYIFAEGLLLNFLFKVLKTNWIARNSIFNLSKRLCRRFAENSIFERIISDVSCASFQFQIQ